MPWVRDTELSLRDNICEHLKARFEDAQSGVDGRTITWQNVHRAPLPKADKLTDFNIALLDTRERKFREIASERCHLTFVTEFAVRLYIGDNVAAELNKVVTEVQQIMVSDISAGGLCLNIVENGSELDIEGPGDRLVGGVIFWDIQYRHKLGDPTKHRGEL